MTLEEFFYSIWIIGAMVFLFLVVYAVIVLLSIYRQLTDLSELLQIKLEFIKDIIMHPRLASARIGGALFDRLLTKGARFFEFEREKEQERKSFFGLLKEAASGWKRDNAGVWCAALAYYTVFSMGPLLLIIISIAGLILANNNFEKEIYGQLQSLLGNQGATMLHTLAEKSEKESSNIISTLVGVITLLLGASGMFGQLQQMLNAIWGVKQKPTIGIFPLIRRRLLNMSMIGVITFLLLVSLLASTAISVMSAFFNQLLPVSPLLIASVNVIFSFLMITILFAFILKVLPDVQLPWSNVWMGAALSSLLFTIGKELISLYIGQTGVSSQYGAAGSLIVLLLWVFYSTQILFYGVEFTKAVTLQKDREIIPSKYAILEKNK